VQQFALDCFSNCFFQTLSAACSRPPHQLDRAKSSRDTCRQPAAGVRGFLCPIRQARERTILFPCTISGLERIWAAIRVHVATAKTNIRLDSRTSWMGTPGRDTGCSFARSASEYVSAVVAVVGHTRTEPRVPTQYTYIAFDWDMDNTHVARGPDRLPLSPTLARLREGDYGPWGVWSRDCISRPVRCKIPPHSSANIQANTRNWSSRYGVLGECHLRSSSSARSKRLRRLQGGPWHAAVT
jgi:hypothetical protein